MNLCRTPPSLKYVSGAPGGLWFIKVYNFLQLKDFLSQCQDCEMCILLMWSKLCRKRDFFITPEVTKSLSWRVIYTFRKLSEILIYYTQTSIHNMLPSDVSAGLKTNFSLAFTKNTYCFHWLSFNPTSHWPLD